MDTKFLEKITSILNDARDLTIATVRPDGFPQATTVSYVNDGLKIYFGTGNNSQKTKNISACDKVSVTVNLPYENWDDIKGLSLAAKAKRVAKKEEIDRISELMLSKFPQIAEFAAPEEMDEVVFFEIDPTVVSVLDYSKGFGHTDEVRV